MRKSPLLAAIGLVVAIGTPSFGATFTFNFNSLTGYSSTAGNQEASIASQLQAQLQTVCPACTVTATTGTVAAIDKTYTGEGFAVGPTNGLTGSNGRDVSETLGDTPANAVLTGNSQYTYSQLTTQGFSNQFLANTNDNSGSLGTPGSEISFQFKGLTITGASFNFEIFPSATPGGFTFEAGNNTSGTDTTIFSQSAVKPCATMNNCGAGSGTDGSSNHSPNSGVSTAETNTQYIGSWSGSFSGSTELDFVDWPVTIGIDNLTITYTTPVPEPGSVLLLATAAVGIFFSVRRRLRKV